MGCGASTSAHPPPPANAEPLVLRDPLAEVPVPAADDDVLQETIDDVGFRPARPGVAGSGGAAEPRGIQLALSSSSGQTRSQIMPTSTPSSLSDDAFALQGAGGRDILGRVDLGRLHAAFEGLGAVSEAKFGEVIGSLLPPAERPGPEPIAALFRVFDADSSGAVDECELVAGCSQASAARWNPRPCSRPSLGPHGGGLELGERARVRLSHASSSSAPATRQSALASPSSASTRTGTAISTAPRSPPCYAARLSPPCETCTPPSTLPTTATSSPLTTRRACARRAPSPAAPAPRPLPPRGACVTARASRAHLRHPRVHLVRPRA
jgi:hypothetical protein